MSYAQLRDAAEAARGRTLASAKSMIATQLNESWKPQVWENLGWHYAAKIDVPGGECRVMPSGGDKYTCYFNGTFQFVYTADTARAAVLGAFYKARSFIDQQTNDNNALFAALK